MKHSKKTLLVVCVSLALAHTAALGQTLGVSLASIQLDEARFDGSTGSEISGLVALGTYTDLFLSYRYVEKNAKIGEAFVCDTYWPSNDNCVSEDRAVESSTQTATMALFVGVKQGHVGFGIGAGFSLNYVSVSEHGVLTGRDTSLRVPGDPLPGFVVLARVRYQPWTASRFQFVASGSADTVAFGECVPDGGPALCGTSGRLAWSVGAAYDF